MMVTDKVAFLILASLLGAQPLRAQPAIDGLDKRSAAEARLEPGAYETVWLMDGSKVTGTFVKISGDLIEITPVTRFPVPSRQVSFNEISMIRQGRNDSFVNGAVLGFAVGGGITFAAFRGITCSGCHWDPRWLPAAYAGLFGGIGAGVGVGLDALFRHGTLQIYSRPRASGSTVHVSPLLGPERKGVSLLVGF